MRPFIVAISIAAWSMMVAGFATPAVAATAESPATASVEKRFKPQKNLRITTGKSAFGTMLFDRRRQAVYAFDKEKSARSRCYGACAAAWPPVLTKGRPKAKGKARQKLLGRTKRKGGATQVIYRGKPLYYYAHEAPGQVFCHNVFQYGGLWLVLHPNGKAAD